MSKKIIYQTIELEVTPEVYRPAEDTFLIAKNLEIEKGEEVLELGVGCGLLSIIATKEGAKVIATDISSHAKKTAEKNATLEGVNEKIEFRKGDLFKPIKDEKFDLIIFNPPYLPVTKKESQNTEIEKAWDGGPSGRKVIDRFLNQVLDYLKPNGRFIFVQSSLSGFDETMKKLEKSNLEVDVKTKKLSFERLYLIEARQK